MLSWEEMEVSTPTLWGSSAKSATKGVNRLLDSLPMRKSSTGAASQHTNVSSDDAAST